MDGILDYRYKIEYPICLDTEARSSANYQFTTEQD